MTNKKDTISDMDEKKDKGLQETKNRGGNSGITAGTHGRASGTRADSGAQTDAEQGQFIVAVEPPSADVQEAVMMQAAGTAMRLQAVRSDGKNGGRRSPASKKNN